jgi:flagellar hook-associated protein 2
VGDQVRVLNATTGALLYNADYSSGLITGREGTSLDGVQLVYTGDGVDTIDIASTQGIADRSYNVLDGFLTKDTGLVDITIQAINDQDTQLQDNIDKENIDIAAERQILIDKFTQLEAIITQANSTLSFLDAQRNSDNSNN